jgi:hypothetical protein
VCRLNHRKFIDKNGIELYLNGAGNVIRNAIKPRQELELERDKNRKELNKKCDSNVLE